MARHYQRRNIVSCGNCGANYDARGEDPRCPACNARLADYEPDEPRPAIRGFDDGLEGPDLLRSRESSDDETAPIEDFVAAALVFIAFTLMVVAVFTASPIMLNIGVAMFAFTAIFYAAWKLFQLVTGRRKRKEHAYEPPSLMEWMFGRGFWDRFR